MELLIYRNCFLTPIFVLYIFGRALNSSRFIGSHYGIDSWAAKWFCLIYSACVQIFMLLDDEWLVLVIITINTGRPCYVSHIEDEDFVKRLLILSTSRSWKQEKKQKGFADQWLMGLSIGEKTIDSWKDSSMNLWRLLILGMNSWEESLLTVIYKDLMDCKGVPHPLSGDYTPKPQEEIDDSLYVYGKKGPQKPEISVSDENSSEHSTCQSNDSEGSCGNTSEHSFETESEKSIQLNAGRPNFNSIRPNINTGRTNINSGRPKVNAVSPKVNNVRSKQPVTHKTSNSMSPKRPQMNQINQRMDFLKSYSESVRRPFAKTTTQMSHSNAVMRSWGSAVKTSASYNWRNNRPNFHYNSGPTFNRTVNANGPLGDSRSKGDSGKGKIRVGNLDFDSVSFVKELGHFNLFSISQICDKQHKVLFTETECLVVSSDFKMPDENQILLKVPRHHNMYSFDMKTPNPAKGFACLIAKATSDESKLWHR
ncbi:hypothetical protein Tco_1149181, partial [Tanacetum coccineum]